MSNKSGFRTKKHLGQHFLVDSLVIDRIIKTINIGADDTIIEIGPGTGAMTDILLDKAKQVYAVEVDKEAASVLLAKHGTNNHFTLIQNDVLKTDLSQISSIYPVRMVGNLPYNLSSPIIFHILACLQSVHDIHIMVQKEVAERMVSCPGTKAYGRLSLGVQWLCHAEIIFDIGPEAFQPPPKVQSSIVRLLPKQNRDDGLDPEAFEKVVRRAFLHRRKKLSGNFKNILTKEEFHSIGIDPACRAEELSLEQFIALTQWIEKNSG